MSAMGKFYLARIDEANSIDEIDYIIEQASENIDNNKEYELIYNTGFRKMQSWMPY